MKKRKAQTYILYEKQCMKVYLNDEKTPVDLRPLYDILCGLKVLCDRMSIFPDEFSLLSY